MNIATISDIKRKEYYMENNNQTMVYIILDCSSSMIGEPIESVRQAIKAMIEKQQYAEALPVIFQLSPLLPEDLELLKLRQKILQETAEK